MIAGSGVDQLFIGLRCAETGAMTMAAGEIQTDFRERILNGNAVGIRYRLELLDLVWIDGHHVRADIASEFLSISPG